MRMKQTEQASFYRGAEGYFDAYISCVAFQEATSKSTRQNSGNIFVVLFCVVTESF